VSGSLVSLHLWIKSAHIVSIVAWMAGLLYLPRLFVYHAMAVRGSEQSNIFKTMERRLYNGITYPAMVSSWIFGVLLAMTPGVVDWRRGWFWTKLGVVIALTVYHFVLGSWRRDFAADRNTHSPHWFRSVNELPTIALIAIVVLVVVKPF
jgi:putative membrane protein